MKIEEMSLEELVDIFFKYEVPDIRLTESKAAIFRRFEELEKENKELKELHDDYERMFNLTGTYNSMLSKYSLQIADLTQQVEEEFAKGWQLAHNPAKCGHPRACYLDPDYPESEGNEKCIMCALKKQVEQGRKACKLASAALIDLHPIMKLEEPCHIFEAYKACMAFTGEGLQSDKKGDGGW